MPSALTDVQDIGRYVAKIIADPRTLNKMVFAHSEVWTQQQIFDKVEELSGEKLERNYVRDSLCFTTTLPHRLARCRFANVTSEKVPGEVLQAQIAGLLGPDRAEPADAAILQKLWFMEYQYSWGIRGDNTPEHSKYLGYLLGKELYPDLEFTSYESYLKNLLEGKATRAYA